MAISCSRGDAFAGRLNDPDIEAENLARILAGSHFDLDALDVHDDYWSRCAVRRNRNGLVVRDALEKAKAIRADEKAKELRRARDARIGYAFLAFVFLLIVLAVVFG